MEPIEWLLYGEAHGSLMAKMESMGGITVQDEIHGVVSCQGGAHAFVVVQVQAHGDMLHNVKPAVALGCQGVSGSLSESHRVSLSLTESQ